jgi:hypothetical protein
MHVTVVNFRLAEGYTDEAYRQDWSAPADDGRARET